VRNESLLAFYKGSTCSMVVMQAALAQTTTKQAEAGAVTVFQLA
jgi:hypothetical protein